MPNDGNAYYEFLEVHGVPLAETLDIEGFALSAGDVLRAIELARQCNLVILGGDAYFVSDGQIGPPQGHYAWTTGERRREEESPLIRRNVNERAETAKAAIARLTAAEGAKLWFSLVVIK